MSIVESIIAGILAVIVILAVIGGYSQIQARSICLAAGYPEVRGNLFISFYCVKRVDQTDVVLPIGKVIK